MHIENDWDTLEDQHFKNVECLRVQKGGKTYRVVGVCGTNTMTKLDKKVKGPKLIEKVVANPRTFLDGADHCLIHYGLWTCKCEKEWVRTGWTNVCGKCGCSIRKNTKKAEYIEEKEIW